MTDVRNKIPCLCIWHDKAILMPSVKNCNIFIQSAAVFVFHNPFFKRMEIGLLQNTSSPF